jgi:N-acetylmuramoyl-L-alanine amidase
VTDFFAWLASLMFKKKRKIGEGMKLAIIVGHSAKAKGAYSPILKQSEYDYWSDFALDLWRECREHGMDAQVFKRDGSTISGVARSVSNWLKGEGLVIELHFNDFLSPSANGIETLYADKTIWDLTWAKSVHTELLRALQEPNPNHKEGVKSSKPFIGPSDRGIKKLVGGQAGYSSMSQIKGPSCLIEPFFGKNKTDVDRFVRNRRRCVSAIVLAVVDFYRTKGE